MRLRLFLSVMFGFGLIGLLLLDRSSCERRRFEWDGDEGLRACADAGYWPAQVRHGSYLNRTGKPAEAAVWFERAVGIGGGWAAVQVAHAYTPSFEFKGNPRAAVRWHLRALALGEWRSAAELGREHLAQGRPAEAEQWFERAVAVGGGRAAAGIAYGIKQWNRDPPASTSWYHRAATLGEKAGMVGYAEAFANGIGLKRNDADAFRWFKAAASHPKADGYDLFKLAQLYDQGSGTARDPSKALIMIRAARSRYVDDSDLRTRDEMEKMEARLSREIAP